MKSNAELAGAGAAADMPANGSAPPGGGGRPPMEGIGAFVAPPMPAKGSPDERPTDAKGSTDAPPPNAGAEAPPEANGSLPAAKGSSAASCAVSFATPPLLDPGGRQTASCCFGGPLAGGPRRRGAGAGGFGSFGIGTAGARAWLALVSASGSPGMAPAPKL